MEKGKLELGIKYKDHITGFVGTAIAITRYLSGCDRVLLQGRCAEDIKEYWFDIVRLDDVVLSEEQRKSGGPGKVSPSRDPVR